MGLGNPTPGHLPWARWGQRSTVERREGAREARKAEEKMHPGGRGEGTDRVPEGAGTCGGISPGAGLSISWVSWKGSEWQICVEYEEV